MGNKYDNEVCMKKIIGIVTVEILRLQISLLKLYPILVRGPTRVHQPVLKMMSIR